MMNLVTDALADPPLWQAFLPVAVPALLSFAAAVVAGIFASRSRASEHKAQRLRDLEERISERKYQMYKPMITLLHNLVDKEKAVRVARTMPEEIGKFASWVSIYGSDQAIRAFSNFMQTSYSSAPPEIFMRLYYEFVLAVRRDMGYPDTRATIEELMAMRINDIYQNDHFYLAATEPFDKLCERVGWTPPWGQRQGGPAS